MKWEEDIQKETYFPTNANGLYILIGDFISEMEW